MDYITFLHPSNLRSLSDILARDRWKREQHDIRYTRRYGRPPPEVFKVELGTIDGFRFIPTKPA